MVSLATPSPLDRILSEHVKNLSNLILGASGYGQRVQFTQYSDATDYANTFGNTDTTNGRAVKIQYGDPSGAPVTLATFQKSGSRIQSNDGTEYLDVSNSGVAVTGTFTVNGQSVGSGFTVYNVLDHGVTEGTGSTFAGANTTAMQTLWTTTATAGGGIIYFPPGQYAFNATTLNHAQTNTYGISIVGAGRSSNVKFYGTSGSFWAIATTATSPIAQCTMENLYFTFDQNVTSGAALEFGYTSRYLLRNVHVGFDGNALIGIRLSSQASLHVQDSTIIVRDAAGAACVDFRHSAATGGVWFTGCDLSGGGAANANTVGLLFNNTALVDTVVLNSTLVKDHYRSIYSGVAGSGNVSNFQMNGGHLDAAQYNVFLNPVTGGDYENWQFTGVWFAATKSNIDLNVDNGGSITNFLVVGGYMSNATVGAVAVTRGVSGFQLDGVTISAGDTNNASYAAIEFYTAGGASPSNVRVTGCQITVGASSAACLKTASGATPLLFANNVLRGSADADGIVDAGATSAARVITGNAYAA